MITVMKTSTYTGPQKNLLLHTAILICILFFNSGIYSQINQWTSRGPGGGGALFSPSFSPHNANEIYMSCDMSELFRSGNLGLSWTEIDFREMTGNNGAKVQFTNNPNINFCINFENDLRAPFKSTNGGLNWFAISSDPTFGEAYSLFADINNSDNLVASDYTTIYFSSNSGNSFSQKYNNPNGCHTAGAFFSGNNIYLGLDNGILTSTNSGLSFAFLNISGIPAEEAIVSFAGAKQNNTLRFFCITLGSGDVYPGVTGADHYGYKKIYAIDSGQTSWTQKTSGINSSHHPFFISMPINNVNTVYAAGGSEAGEPVVYKSTNGGNNWSSVFITNNNQNIFTGWSGHGGDRGWSYGEYALGFECSPIEPNKVIITDLGFAHLTTNGGISWNQIYLNSNDQNPMNSLITQGKHYRGTGLENTSCWWLTWSDSVNIFGSYSDIRAVRSTDGGNFWSFNYSGNTFNTMYQCIKHPSNGNIYGAVSSLHDMYQSTYLTDARINGGTGRILFSTNKGLAWQTLHDFAHPVISLSIDPNNSNKMYASVIHSTLGGIFVSDNIQNGGTSTWTKLTNPPRTEGHPFNIKVLNDGTLLCTYSGRRNTSGAFTASSGVFVSTNAGVNWIDRSSSGMLYWTKDIIIDPNDVSQNKWYCCVFSGWGGPPNGLGGLYKTTNRGINWSKINNLDRVESCTISPVNPNEMYLSTEVNGLWYSGNINSPSPSFSEAAGYKFRQPERIFFNPFNPNEVWVTSFGNGIKVGYTNPLSLQLNITYGIEGFWNGSVQAPDTIKIFLRNNFSPYSKADSSKILINTFGNANAQFTNAVSGNFYLQIIHRNALETWSSTALAFTAGQTSNYDFTISQSQAFGNNQKNKLSRWCAFSGDVNQDGIIDITDLQIIDNNAASFLTGYINSDLTGDNFTDIGDLAVCDNNASGFVSVIKP